MIHQIFQVSVNRLKLGPIKKKFSLSSPPASEFPTASNSSFFICYIPHENKVNGFVSVVVMNCKFKKTRFAGCSGY